MQCSVNIGKEKSRDNECMVPHNFIVRPHAQIHCLCDKVDHKQEVRLILYILGQIVTWLYIPNLLD